MQIDEQTNKFYHIDMKQEVVEESDDNATNMFIESHIHDCLIRIGCDGSVFLTGQSIDQEPLKVNFHPFDDKAQITMVEMDAREKYLVFVNDMNVIHIFNMIYLLQSNLDTNNLLFTELAHHSDTIQ
jgi:hypothetical protein